MIILTFFMIDHTTGLFTCLPNPLFGALDGCNDFINDFINVNNIIIVSAINLGIDVAVRRSATVDVNIPLE